MHPGIKVNQARTNYGDTPLYVASQEGHVEIVKAPLAQPNINVNQAQTDLEWKGISPLWIASFNRHAEVVKELLKESEIKVNQAQTTDGRTALYIASIKGFLEVVQVLLVHPGINVNQARTNYASFRISIKGCNPEERYTFPF